MLLSVNKHRGPETLKSLIDSLVGWFIHLFSHSTVSWVVSGSEGPGPAPFSAKTRIPRLPEISFSTEKKLIKSNKYKMICPFAYKKCSKIKVK